MATSSQKECKNFRNDAPTSLPLVVELIESVYFGSLSCQHIPIGAGGLASFPGSVKSDTMLPTARLRCDISSQLCYPGA